MQGEPEPVPLASGGELCDGGAAAERLRRAGRGAEAQGARGAKKVLPGRERGAQQKCQGHKIFLTSQSSHNE